MIDPLQPNPFQPGTPEYTLYEGGKTARQTYNSSASRVETIMAQAQQMIDDAKTAANTSLVHAVAFENALNALGHPV